MRLKLPLRDKAKNAGLANYARGVMNAPVPPMQEAVAPIGAGQRLLDKEQVLDRVPWSYPMIWKMMREGKFPRSLVLGNKVSGSDPRSTNSSLACRGAASRAIRKRRDDLDRRLQEGKRAADQAHFTRR
jgi:hypothetical protein